MQVDRKPSHSLRIHQAHQRGPRLHPVALGVTLALVIAAGLVAVQSTLAGRSFDLGWMLARLSSEAVSYAYLVGAFAIAYGLMAAAFERSREQLVRQSLTDSLTGVYNRRYFEIRMREELARAKRHRSPLSLLLVDLDQLKHTNDTQGHQTGDRVLVAVAQALTDASRSTDVVARIGGDEFAVLAPCTSSTNAMELAARIGRLTDTAPEPFETGALRVSIGVADLADLGAGGASDLYESADRALYEAKRQGGNCSMRFSRRHSSMLIERTATGRHQRAAM